MVVGQPYIHFKVNNEPIEEVIDYNYTWATVVEARKGPINTPTYISSAAQAYSIFGIDMRPYFAQTPRSLIMVRAAATSDTNAPQKGKYSFNLENDFVAYKAMQDEITLKNVESYHDIVTDTWKWKEVPYTFKLFYVYENNKYIPVIELRDSNGTLIPESYIDAWHDNGRIVTDAEATANQSKSDRPANKDDLAAVTDPEPIEGALYPYKEKYANKASKVYNKNQVKEFLTPTRFEIDAEYVDPDDDSDDPKMLKTSLFDVESKYEGIYNVSISCSRAISGKGYRIAIKDKDTDTISLLIQNGTNIENIVNRINDADLDITAKMTTAGKAITQAMSAHPYTVTTTTISGFNPLITSAIVKDSFIMSQGVPTSTIINNEKVIIYEKDNVSYLTQAQYEEIQRYEALSAEDKKKTTKPSIDIINYEINLVSAGEQSLIGGNRGEWDESAQRIATGHQATAHAEALKTLRRIRLAGVFCMYGEEAIQYEYLQHGKNDSEPEKGMNNNETCKWRTILLGANTNNRSDIASLIAKAKNINNQYVLFLGQGLIDTGMTGYLSTLSAQEKQAAQEGNVEDGQLLPYECTQYVAGLRSKLNYGESIFGGQGRKRIRSVGDLKIAPIVKYESEYSWDPNTYIRLNEGGVLTFTEDYGNITLTDGVTTSSSTKSEEDEEGVMNILKYAENAIYDVCLPYIGRNIDADIENSITTAIEKVLEEMKTTDQTLIDTEQYPAYDVTVALNSRRNQLLGRIYIYATICPVHAVRQIEVEMTVQ